MIINGHIVGLMPKPLVKFMKTMLDQSAPPEVLATEAANIKMHFETMKNKEMEAHDNYINTYEMPRQERDAQYAEYLAEKTALLEQWRATRSRTTLYEYITLQPKKLETESSRVEIYTKFV